MSRDGTRTRDRPDNADEAFAAEFEIGGEATERGGEDASDAGIRTRASARVKRLFSPRVFLAALLLTFGGLFAASTFLPIPGSGLLGVFLAAFLIGFAVKERRYAEIAVAGAVAAAASTLLDFAVVAFLGGFGISLAVLAGAIGAVVGGLGTYFGRDLRDGLTREL